MIPQGAVPGKFEGKILSVSPCPAGTAPMLYFPSAPFFSFSNPLEKKDILCYITHSKCNHILFNIITGEKNGKNSCTEDL